MIQKKKESIIMAGVNRIYLIGNLTREPELKQSNGGKPICRLGLAVNDKRGPNDNTEYFTVVCFDRTAEIANQYLKKGSPVFIEGRIQTRKWTDKEGAERTSTEVLASNLTLLGGSAPTGKSTAPKPKSAIDEHFDNMPF